MRGFERGRECRDRPMLFGFPQMFSHFGTRGIKKTTKVLNYKYARTPRRQKEGHPVREAPTLLTVALPSRYRTAVCSDGVERHLASLSPLLLQMASRRGRSDSCQGRVRPRDTRALRPRLLHTDRKGRRRNWNRTSEREGESSMQ